MSEPKTTKKLGTKWFTFYTKVRPWLACLMTLSLIVDFTQYTDVYVSNWWMLLYFISAIAQPILGIIVFVKSFGNYADFVRFVKVVLFFEIINMAYQQAVQQYLNSNLNIGTACITFVAVYLISYFVWWRLNVKYFEKRINVITGDSLDDDPNRITECKSCGYQDKNYFDACPKCGNYAKKYVYPNGKEEHKAAEIPCETARVRYCTHCGNKLTENDKFCGNCGTHIIK